MANAVGKPSKFTELKDHPNIRKLLINSEKRKKGLRTSQTFKFGISSPRGEIIQVTKAKKEHIKSKQQDLQLPVHLVNSDPPVKKKSSKPHSARSSGSVISTILYRSSSEKMHKEIVRPNIKQKRKRSLPATQLRSHLETIRQQETISEELPLFEEVPTPRSQKRKNHINDLALHLDRETISEESPLYEEAPTPRSQRRANTLNSDAPIKQLCKSISSPMQKQRQYASTLAVETTPVIGRRRSNSSAQDRRPGSFLKLRGEEKIVEKDCIEREELAPPVHKLQKQVTIPVLREKEECSISEDIQVSELEKQLMQTQTQLKQMRIELNMTKKLLEKANRKLLEKDQLIAKLQH